MIPRPKDGPVRATAGAIAVLFFAADRGRPERASRRAADHPAYQIGNPGLTAGLAAADTGPALRRLLVHWAAGRPAGDEFSQQQFALAAGAGPIPEAVPVLAQLAKDPDVPIRNVRPAAVWALGRIASPDAQAALKGLTADRTWVDAGAPNGVCRLGDCALAALTEAKGRKPADLGMVIGGRGTILLKLTAGGASVKVPVYGFPDDEARQIAQKKLAAEPTEKK